LSNDVVAATEDGDTAYGPQDRYEKHGHGSLLFHPRPEIKPLSYQSVPCGRSATNVRATTRATLLRRSEDKLCRSGRLPPTSNFMSRQRALGDYFGWDHAYCIVSSGRYESYAWAYECRVYPLCRKAARAADGHQELLAPTDVFGKLRCFVLRRRTLCVARASGRRREIPHSTPEKAIEVFVACANFVIAESKRDPNFKPPENFLDVARTMFSILDEALLARGEKSFGATTVA
jgi:hypothetical protein